ncbi:MAG TPA: hypothetical protein GXX75_00690 [Clostridiales bacterium]|nr:hypothetical protein [Clostridiales bacterium]
MEEIKEVWDTEREAMEDKFEKLRDELKIAVCQYSDYNDYWGMLEGLLESYDESLEHYDFEAWFSGGGKDSRGKLTVRAMKMLRLTTGLFQEIHDLAELRLKRAVDNILEAGEEAQKEILGLEINQEVVDRIFEQLYDLEYRYHMEEAYEGFLEFVKDIAGKEKP